MASFLYADSSQIYTSSPFEPQALDSASYLASPLGWEAVGLLHTHPPEKPTDAPRLHTHSLMPQPPTTTSCRFHLLISFKSASFLSPSFPLHCPHFHSISPKSLWQLPFWPPASPPDEWSHRDINMKVTNMISGLKLSLSPHCPQGQVHTGSGGSLICLPLLFRVPHSVPSFLGSSPAQLLPDPQ